MNKYRREITIEILVGLFMFTVLIALGIFTIVLSRENLLQKSYPYEFVFQDVNGLRRGDNVFLRGMNVGRVSETELDEGNVRVYTSLDIPINLRRGYNIEILSSSMLGGKYLRIDEGDSEQPLIGDNVTILGTTPTDVMEDLGAAVNSFQGMLDDVEQGQGTLGLLLKEDTIYNNMLEMSEDLKGIVSRLSKGESTVGRLLTDDAELYTDLAASVASLRNLTGGLEKGEGTIGRLMKEEELYEDTRALMANLRKLSEGLSSGEGTLARLFSPDDQVYTDLAASLAAIRSISERINNGEGTMGKLVNDPALYDEAVKFMETAGAAVDDLRESSPITSFGSIFFGAF